MSVAVNIHLGHKLGANDSEGASNSYRITLSVAGKYIMQHTTCEVTYTVTHASQGVLVIFACSFFVFSGMTAITMAIILTSGKEILPRVFTRDL